MSDLLKLKDARDQRNAKKKFMQELKESPMTSQEYWALTNDMTPANRISIFNKLEKKGLIKEGPEMTWDEFAGQEAENEKFPIKRSTYAHMSNDEKNAFVNRVGLARYSIYSDIPAGSKPVHYLYRDSSGKTRQSGDGHSIEVRDRSRRASYSVEERDQILASQKANRKARNDIRDIFNRLSIKV